MFIGPESGIQSPIQLLKSDVIGEFERVGVRRLAGQALGQALGTELESVRAMLFQWFVLTAGEPVVLRDVTAATEGAVDEGLIPQVRSTRSAELSV